MSIPQPPRTSSPHAPARSCDTLTRLVVSCLLAPERSLSITLLEWDLLLRALRRNGLLASFGERLPSDLLARAPGKARTHITYARIAADSIRTAVRFEVNRMLRALREYDGPLVLLKGAAYESQGLSPAAGRMSGDVDVMVPRARIEEVERRLTERGWRLNNQDEYDQRYYREYTHEIPALLHPHRETPIDVHHTIAPLTGRAHPDPEALMAEAVATPRSRLHVLGPADMVLHSTLHLFNDEVSRPLRDLYDIHLLLGHFGDSPRFWQDLCERAQLHGAGRPLYYMLRMVQHVFATDVPASAVNAALAWAPNPVLGRCMDTLFRARFSAGFAGAREPVARIAREMYYLRAHWLRMPPLMLARHLARKSMRRARDRMRRRATDIHAEVA